MDTLEALRLSILDEPGDDSRRLAFADWFDQNGDPARAELIRTQVALALLPPFSTTVVRRSGFDNRRWALESQKRPRRQAAEARTSP